MQAYAVHHQFVLNDRWLFDTTQDRLVDLEGHVGDATLKPVVTRILTLLARSPQILLTRRQLFDGGWRAFGFEVCDNSLSQVMCSLRATFEAVDPGKQYIKTIPRIGYCLLATARPASAQDVHGAVPLRCAPPAAPRTCATGAEPKNLVDRHVFDAIVDGEWPRAQCGDVPLSILMIDVNHPDDFAGRGENAADDDVFASITQSIVQHIHRAGDRAARYDGNVFAVLLPNTGSEGATAVAGKIRTSIQALGSRGVAGASSAMTVSVGVACTKPCHFETLQAFVGAAVAALRETKNASCAPIIRSTLELELAAQ